MARVTVEDCDKRIPNRFELCMIASQRVKEMQSGAPIVASNVNDDDKFTVIALKEIALDSLNIDVLREMLVKSMRSANYLDDAKDSILSTAHETIDDSLELEEDFIFSGDEEGFSEQNGKDGEEEIFSQEGDDENTFDDDINED